MNGRFSHSNRARYISITFYFIKDHINKGDVIYVHCPTEIKVGNFVAKLLQGKLLKGFRDIVIGVIRLDMLC